MLNEKNNGEVVCERSEQTTEQVLDKLEILYLLPDQKQLNLWNAAGWRIVSICANVDLVFCYLTLMY